MSIIMTLILAQLCLFYVSAMAIPPTSAATISIWDFERAISFKVLLAASLRSTHYAPAAKSAIADTKSTPDPTVKVSKRTTTASKAKNLPPMSKMPMGGMQCAVM